MKDIAIYGAGGFGREVACLIQRINDADADWNLIGFFDDTKPIGTVVSHYGSVLGGIDQLNAWDRNISIVIAVGDPKSVLLIKNRIINNNVEFPNVVDPSFRIVDKESFTIGVGNVIQAGCSASCDVSIGDFNVLNGDVAIGHNVTIGDFNVIMPAVRISGNVNIAQRNLIGVGSIILQKIYIEEDVVLGSGAVLLTKPKNGNTYLGNPAKLFKF
jgi:sugar O-acyltransferase (sialic acid O-acetyltransferase NeuD family)